MGGRGRGNELCFAASAFLLIKASILIYDCCRREAVEESVGFQGAGTLFGRWVQGERKSLLRVVQR